MYLDSYYFRLTDVYLYRSLSFALCFLPSWAVGGHMGFSFAKVDKKSHIGSADWGGFRDELLFWLLISFYVF
jgi:hypothetical protein